MPLLIAPVAGRYAGTFQPAAAGGASGAGGPATSLGILDDSGFEVAIEAFSDPVTNTDAYAKTVLDQLSQGANVRIRFKCKEFSQTSLYAAYTYGISTGAMD